MEVLTKGTIEPLMVALRDRLENIDDLSTVLNPKFSTRKKSDDSAVESNKTWTVDPGFPMTALCLIDTTVSAYDAGETYKLYLTWEDGSQSPLKGPIEFRVEGD